MDNEKRNREIEQYITAFRAGDKNAFEQLYRCTEKYIYFCIMNEGLPPEVVSDVMQEVYLAVYEGLDSLRDIHAALGWMKKIAFHKSMDYYRRQGKIQLLSNEETEESEDTEIPDFMNLPEEIMEKQELQRMVQELLGKLSKEQQWMLKAYYFEECKVKEIAEQMGLSENTVKTKLARARKQLQLSVEKLERQQGIRLHSLEAAPVLLFLLDLQAEATGVPTDVSLSIMDGLKTRLFKISGTAADMGEGMETLAKTGAQNLAEEGMATAGEQVSHAGSTVGKAATQIAGKGSKLAGAIAKKWIAGIVAVVLIGGVTLPFLLKGKEETENETVAENAQTKTTQEASVTEEKSSEEETESTTEEAVKEPEVDPERQAELVAYYHELFERMSGEHVWPDGTDIPISEAFGDSISYAVLDFDGDGYVEFGVSVTQADYMAAYEDHIFKYNPDTGECRELLRCRRGAEYYKDGKAFSLMENPERTTTQLYVYDSKKQEYVFQVSVRCIDKSWTWLSEISADFPEDADKDKDGIVFEMKDEDGNFITYMDQSEYDAWRGEQLDETAKIDVGWILFSEGWKYE